MTKLSDLSDTVLMTELSEIRREIHAIHNNKAYDFSRKAGKRLISLKRQYRKRSLILQQRGR